MKYNIYQIKLLLFLSFLFTGCQRYPNDVENVLKHAGDNRAELENALESFRMQPADSLQYNAACFLIANMQRHYSWDTSSLYLYRNMLIDLDSMLTASISNRKVISDRWGNIIGKRPLQKHVYGKRFADSYYISGSFLVKDINLAIDTWLTNPYRDSISQTNFFEYVLPYRKRKGLAHEDWRSFFYNRHHLYFQELYPRPVMELVDSLLYQYHEFSNLAFGSFNFPFLKYEDVMLARRGICETKCWFNTLTLASVGLPVAVDFVPYWANRDNGHSWNSIQWGNTFYAFEPFWDVNRWKYKALFNNQYDQDEWGKFRIAKIYRYTYRAHTDGPGFDKEMNPQNVPPEFFEAERMDVSQQYFLTTDVKLSLENQKENDRYAWLCVFNNNRWVPVQWGMNKKKSPTFKNMGRDILYLPAYYRMGNVIPAGSPFILNADGNIRKIEPSNDTENISVTQTSFERPSDKRLGRSLVGSKIQGANKPDFSDATTLTLVDQPVQFSMVTLISDVSKFKYVRFVFPNKEVVANRSLHNNRINAYGNIAELIFTDDQENSITGNVIHSPGVDHGNTLLAFDHQPYTSMKGINIDSFPPNKIEWVGLELEQPTRIGKVTVMPGNDDTYLFYGATYELSYWRNGRWQPLGKQKALTASLSFTGVPRNTLLLLSCPELQLKVRPFTYENGKQIWW